MRSLTIFVTVSIAEFQQRPNSSATTIIDEITVYIPLSSVVDNKKVTERLQKRVVMATSDLQNVEETLANKNFVERAPKEVIDQKYERKDKLESEKEKILANLHMLN